jgi:hypothetical protein
MHLGRFIIIILYPFRLLAAIKVFTYKQYFCAERSMVRWWVRNHGNEACLHYVFVTFQINAGMKLWNLFWWSQKLYVAISRTKVDTVAITLVFVLPSSSRNWILVCVLPSNGSIANYEAVCEVMLSWVEVVCLIQIYWCIFSWVSYGYFE